MSDAFDLAFFGQPGLGTWQDWTLKGSLVRSRRRYLDAHAPDRIAAIRSVIGPEARHYLEGDVLVSARLPYPPLVELDKQIVLLAMGGQVSGMRTLADEIAKFDLDGGLYRGLFRLIGGTLSMRVYAMAYQTYFQPGSVSVSEGNAESIITLNDVILPRYMCEFGFTGYLERMLRMARDERTVRHDCVHAGQRQCSWRVGDFRSLR